jgi:hypothetical protein
MPENLTLFHCPFTSSPSSPLFDTIANPPPPEHPSDYVKAEKNGTQWMARATTFFTEGSDTLIIIAHAKEESLAYQSSLLLPKRSRYSSIGSFISVGRRLEGKRMLAEED